MDEDSEEQKGRNQRTTIVLDDDPIVDSVGMDDGPPSMKKRAITSSTFFEPQKPVAASVTPPLEGNFARMFQKEHALAKEAKQQKKGKKGKTTKEDDLVEDLICSLEPKTSPLAEAFAKV